MVKRKRIPTVWPKELVEDDPLLPPWTQKETWSTIVGLLTRVVLSAGYRIVRIPRRPAKLIKTRTGGVCIVAPEAAALGLIEAEQFDVEAVLARLSSRDRMDVQQGRAVPEAIVEKFAHELYAVIRTLYYDTHARIAWQRTTKIGSKTRRRIHINWLRQSATPLAQLRGLAQAAVSNSPYKWERAWLALTGRARRHLQTGFEEARRRGEFRAFKGELEKDGQILAVSVPTPEFALLALPYAIRAAERTGRPSRQVEYEVLAAIFDIYVMLTVPCAADRSRRGIVAAARTGGIPFVRDIEEIFRAGGASELRLMACDEERDFRKARLMMKSLPPVAGKKR